MIKRFWNWLIYYNGCANCEFLRELLEQERRNNKALIEGLLNNNKPVSNESSVKEELEPIRPKFVPFRIKQQMMEQDSLVRAEQLEADKLKLQRETELLERELDIHSTDPLYAANDVSNHPNQ